MTKLTTIRARKMRDQKDRCYYCDAPMWTRNPRQFSRRHGVTMRSVHHFQCTAEHLVARCDGGTNAVANIVAACAYCNQRRHQLKRPPDAVTYRERVRRRVQRGTYRTVLTAVHDARAREMRRASGRRHATPSTDRSPAKISA